MLSVTGEFVAFVVFLRSNVDADKCVLNHPDRVTLKRTDRSRNVSFHQIVYKCKAIQNNRPRIYSPFCSVVCVFFLWLWCNASIRIFSFVFCFDNNRKKESNAFRLSAISHTGIFCWVCTNSIRFGRFDVPSISIHWISKQKFVRSQLNSIFYLIRIQHKYIGKHIVNYPVSFRCFWQNVKPNE